VDPATPPALQPGRLKFLISTLNQPPQHPAKLRSPGVNFERKSLGTARCTQVVAAEGRIRNDIKDDLFLSKRKAGLSSSHSRAVGFSSQDKLCITKCSSQDKICITKCSSQDKLCDIKCASQDKLCVTKCASQDKLCVTKCASQDKLCDIKCSSQDKLCDIKCSSQGKLCDIKCSSQDKLCVTKCASQGKLCDIKCSSWERPRVIKSASQGDAALPRETRRRVLRQQVLPHSP
jgi:WD40 repeat protein